jgi:hypothetical protein
VPRAAWGHKRRTFSANYLSRPTQPCRYGADPSLTAPAPAKASRRTTQRRAERPPTARSHTGCGRGPVTPSPERASFERGRIVAARRWPAPRHSALAVVARHPPRRRKPALEARSAFVGHRPRVGPRQERGPASRSAASRTAPWRKQRLHTAQGIAFDRPLRSGRDRGDRPSPGACAAGRPRRAASSVLPPVAVRAWRAAGSARQPVRTQAQQREDLRLAAAQRQRAVRRSPQPCSRPSSAADHARREPGAERLEPAHQERLTWSSAPRTRTRPTAA